MEVPVMAHDSAVTARTGPFPADREHRSAEVDPFTDVRQIQQQLKAAGQHR